MELALAQFAGKGPVRAWDCTPAARGTIIHPSLKFYSKCLAHVPFPQQFPSVAYQMSPMFCITDNGSIESFHCSKRDLCPLPFFYAFLLLRATDSVMSLGFVLASSAPSSSTPQVSETQTTSDVRFARQSVSSVIFLTRPCPDSGPTVITLNKFGMHKIA